MNRDLMERLKYGHLSVDCHDTNFIFLFYEGMWALDIPKR